MGLIKIIFLCFTIVLITVENGYSAPYPFDFIEDYPLLEYPYHQYYHHRPYVPTVYVPIYFWNKWSFRRPIDHPVLKSTKPVKIIRHKINEHKVHTVRPEGFHYEQELPTTTTVQFNNTPLPYSNDINIIINNEIPIISDSREDSDEFTGCEGNDFNENSNEEIEISIEEIPPPVLTPPATIQQEVPFPVVEIIHDTDHKPPVINPGSTHDDTVPVINVPVESTPHKPLPEVAVNVSTGSTPVVSKPEVPAPVVSVTVKPEPSFNVIKVPKSVEQLLVGNSPTSKVVIKASPFDRQVGQSTLTSLDSTLVHDSQSKVLDSKLVAQNSGLSTVHDSQDRLTSSQSKSEIFDSNSDSKVVDTSLSMKDSTIASNNKLSAVNVLNSQSTLSSSSSQNSKSISSSSKLLDLKVGPLSVGLNSQIGF